VTHLLENCGEEGEHLHSEQQRHTSAQGTASVHCAHVTALRTRVRGRNAVLISAYLFELLWAF
jgi:hypothetical protein